MLSVVRLVIVGALGAGVCGFAAGYLTARQEEPRGSSFRSASALSEDASSGGEDPAEVEQRIARLCVREVLAMQRGAAFPRRASSQVGVDGSAQEQGSAQQDSFRDQLDQILVLVRDKGLWSRGAGAKARYLLSQLPHQESWQLREELDSAAESGAVRLQAGAWLPMAAP